MGKGVPGSDLCILVCLFCQMTCALLVKYVILLKNSAQSINNLVLERLL